MPAHLMVDTAMFAFRAQGTLECLREESAFGH